MVFMKRTVLETLSPIQKLRIFFSVSQIWKLFWKGKIVSGQFVRKIYLSESKSCMLVIIIVFQYYYAIVLISDQKKQPPNNWGVVLSSNTCQFIDIYLRKF